MEQPYAEFLRRFEDGPNNWKLSNTDKAVVLTEGNARWQVPLVLKNFKYFLGDGWNLYIFATRYNADWIKQQLPGVEYKLSIIDQPRINPHIFNRLYKTPAFWQSIPEEHILTIQADCICCRPLESKWLAYDMVGAPCGVDTLNGGLSLRRRSAMLKVLGVFGLFKDNDSEPEDVFFTKCLRALSANLPSAYDAAFFAAESLYYGLPFGVHGTDKGYHSLHVAQRIIDQVSL